MRRGGSALALALLAGCAPRVSAGTSKGSIAGDCRRACWSVSSRMPTITSWVGVLEASYLAHVIPPYHSNFGKRVIKAPKLYLSDPSLVCELTRQPDGPSAVAGPLGGSLLEGWVVTEATKQMANRGLRPDLYHWRSNDQLEVDLLIGAGPRLLPVEVKLTATPTTNSSNVLWARRIRSSWPSVKGSKLPA